MNAVTSPETNQRQTPPSQNLQDFQELFNQSVQKMMINQEAMVSTFIAQNKKSDAIFQTLYGILKANKEETENLFAQMTNPQALKNDKEEQAEVDRMTEEEKAKHRENKEALERLSRYEKSTACERRCDIFENQALAKLAEMPGGIEDITQMANRTFKISPDDPSPGILPHLATKIGEFIELQHQLEVEQYEAHIRVQKQRLGRKEEWNHIKIRSDIFANLTYNLALKDNSYAKDVKGWLGDLTINVSHLIPKHGNKNTDSIRYYEKCKNGETQSRYSPENRICSGLTELEFIKTILLAHRTLPPGEPDDTYVSQCCAQFSGLASEWYRLKSEQEQEGKFGNTDKINRDYLFKCKEQLGELSKKGNKNTQKSNREVLSEIENSTLKELRQEFNKLLNELSRKSSTLLQRKKDRFDTIIDNPFNEEEKSYIKKCQKIQRAPHDTFITDMINYYIDSNPYHFTQACEKRFKDKLRWVFEEEILYGRTIEPSIRDILKRMESETREVYKQEMQTALHELKKLERCMEMAERTPQKSLYFSIIHRSLQPDPIKIDTHENQETYEYVPPPPPNEFAFEINEATVYNEDIVKKALIRLPKDRSQSEAFEVKPPAKKREAWLPNT
ncbi:MAG: hypothetical protein C5B47_07210 [Verrucomicrobia bacterium]|nr:MAG: hypothetical protein C5B47_07210 [Verrucomicrobiota bacterium]